MDTKRTESILGFTLWRFFFFVVFVFFGGLVVFEIIPYNGKHCAMLCRASILYSFRITFYYFCIL